MAQPLTLKPEVASDGSRARLAALLLVVCVGGYVVALAATRQGTGLTPDSLMYLNGARQLAAGHGYSWPERRVDGQLVYNAISWWPPMVSAVLAVAARVGVNPVNAARHLNGLLLGVNAALVGLIVAHATRDVRQIAPGETTARFSPWPAVLAAALAATLYNLVVVHTYLWSEPLFIFFTLLSLWAAAADAERPRTWTLAGAAAAAGGAYLTRYAGLSVILAGGLALLLLGRQPRLWQRLSRACFFGGGAAVAVAGWMLRNRLIREPDAPAGGVVGRGRAAGFDPNWHAKFGEFTDVLRHSVAPVRLVKEGGDPRLAWVLVVAAGAAAALWWLGRRHWRAQPWPWLDDGADAPPSRRTAVLGAFSLFLLGYLLMLAAAFALVDPTVRFDERFLSPLLPAAIVCGVVFCARAVHDLRSRRTLGRTARRATALLAWASLGLALVTLGGNLYATLDRVADARENGLAYASRQWRASEGLTFIRSLPRDAILYTNVEKLAASLYGVTAARLPDGGFWDDAVAPTRFDMMRSALRRSHGAVLYVRDYDFRDDTIPAADLAARLGLSHYRSPDGAVDVLQLPEDAGRWPTTTSPAAPLKPAALPVPRPAAPPRGGLP